VRRGRLFHQSTGSAPLHPTDRVNELISIEDDEKPFQGAHLVARTRRDVFPEDAPGILDSPQYGVLVRLGHWSRAY
jgi:hypothetical protein